MFYLILVIIGLGILDIFQMRKRGEKKEIAVYVIFMLLVGLFGIFYFTDPERSFSKLILSFIGIKE
ncbi:MAG: hypothetical protein ACOX25_10545 [Caldicoprobacterales bacterium]|jgi:hypothetical protein|nr:hypothetical protein [Clostridiales bacterium]